MKTVKEGLSVKCAARVERLSGSGAIALTSPEFRIVDADHAAIAGFDWAAAVWDAARSEIYQVFDTESAGLGNPAVYHLQLRGIIGGVKYGLEIKVVVEEWGP